MNNTMKWVLAMLVIIVVLLCGYGIYGYFNRGNLGLNIEDYDPYTMYNGGITTALPITTSGALTGGAFSATTGSFSSTLSVTGAATLSSTLAVTGNTTLSGDLAVTGSIIGDAKMVAIAPTSEWATSTLVAADSGKTYMLSGKGVTINLPAVTATGTIFTFIIDGAADTADFKVTSAEGDNIEGSVIVAGAVVDCAAADVLTFVVDGENIGDFFTVVSTGTYWVPLQSGALTSGKLTCSG